MARTRATRTPARAVGVVTLSAVCVALLTAPAEAGQPKKPKQPAQKATVTCVAPGGSAGEFGAARIDLKLRNKNIPADEFYVVVPVDNATGLDSGDRTTIESEQRRAVAFIPGDGASLTPASTLEIRLGGTVLQRIPVRGGCGVVDDTPDAGPQIGTITTSAGTVTVPVTNGSSVSDEIGVTLFPVGGNTGDSRFLTLAPGETGTVTFIGVPAGDYTVEAFGYTSFLGVESGPFSVAG